MKQQVKKAVLAYSGGLDTSIIIPWLKENYGCEVIAMVGNVGQEEGVEGLEEKAIRTGASKVFVEDLRSEFVTESRRVIRCRIRSSRTRSVNYWARRSFKETAWLNC